MISLIAALVLGLITFFLKGTLYPSPALPYILIGLSIAAGTATASFYILTKGIQERVQRFISFVMSSLMVKMFLGITYVIIVSLNFKDFATEIVISYFLFYLVFTFFEVVTLMSNLRAEKSEDENKKSAS